MKLILRDLLKLGGFSECRLISGEGGLGKSIKSITVLEVPEVAKWVNGDEFILTSLYAVKDDLEAQLQLVERLNASGAAGLGIKPAHFIGEIAKEILEKGDELNFPIIEIPENVTYVELMSPVMHALFNNKIVLQEDLERATKILNELSLREQGIQEYAKTIGFLVNNEITIESELPTINSYLPNRKLQPLEESKKQELSIVRRALQMDRYMGDNIIPCMVVPIIVEGDYFGNITSWGDYGEHLSKDIAVLEKAASLLSFEFLKNKMQLDIEQRYESDFIRELLFSQNIREKSVIEWGGNYRITKNDRYACLLFSVINAETKEKQFLVLKNYRLTNVLKQLYSRALVGAIRNGICIIAPVESTNQLKNLAKQYYIHINGQIGENLELSLGVGKPEVGLKGIQYSFLQADKALYFAERQDKKEHISFYEELGVYRLIYSVRNETELNDFFKETFYKLLEEPKSEEFFYTLKVYFDNNESLKETSKELFIHVNTLKYRLGRIEELTGYSLKKSEDKMNLFIGMRIADLVKTD